MQTLTRSAQALTKLSLGLALTLGTAGLSVGCDDTVSSTEKTTVRDDGSMTKKTEETKVDRDDGTVTKETTVEKTDTNR